MPVVEKDETPRVPYQLPMPPDAMPEIVIPDAVSANDEMVLEFFSRFFHPFPL